MMLENAVSTTINSLGFDMGCIYLSDEDEELSLRVHKNLLKVLKICVLKACLRISLVKHLKNKMLYTLPLNQKNMHFLDLQLE